MATARGQRRAATRSSSSRPRNSSHGWLLIAKIFEEGWLPAGVLDGLIAQGSAIGDVRPPSGAACHLSPARSSSDRRPWNRRRGPVLNALVLELTGEVNPGTSAQRLRSEREAKSSRGQDGVKQCARPS